MVELKEGRREQDRPNLPQRDQSLMESVLSDLTFLDLILQQHEAFPHEPDPVTTKRARG